MAILRDEAYKHVIYLLFFIYLSTLRDSGAPFIINNRFSTGTVKKRETSNLMQQVSIFFFFFFFFMTGIHMLVLLYNTLKPQKYNTKNKRPSILFEAVFYFI